MLYRLNLYLLIVILATGCFLGQALAEKTVYIDIQSPYARQFPVAIPDFKALDGLKGQESAAAVRQVLAEDLDFSGLFKNLDRKSYLVDSATMGLTASTTNFSAWNMIGAEFLIKGAYRSDNSNITCELRLFDVKRGLLLTGRRYTGTKADLRIIAHKFADEVMKAITGEPGFFQSKLAYISTQTGYKELYVSDFDGHGATQLTRFRSITLDPAWSPDGRKIAFTSYKDGRPYLYNINVRSRNVRRLMAFKGLNITPAYHPDGREMIATLSKDGDPDLYLANAAGRIIRQLTKSPGIDVSGSFSPDGSLLAFVSNRHGGPQIFIMDMATRSVKRLTYEGKYNTSPSWSPRGDRIAYVGMKHNQFNVFTIAPNGTDVQQLTLDQGDSEHPIWSPDGRMLVFSSTRSGESAIYVMTANGGHAKRITRTKGKQTAPSWSGRLVN